MIVARLLAELLEVAALPQQILFPGQSKQGYMSTRAVDKTFCGWPVTV
ncbi:hypothetical protein VB780_12100 [Leptolyngbya sp. CCNP1308]|nr:hypothetical protein [Leptolyngbya sp. CCNP1308]MEA5449315.1 hypothetical protein [Leptolyngbya sp. CCNP1308]